MIFYAEIKEQKELDTQNWGKSMQKTGCASETESAALAMGQAGGMILERLDEGVQQILIVYHSVWIKTK